jgi:hypothetical protein
MGKVLQFKETSFKQNASKIQSQIDQIQSTDLIKEEDKQYLTEKLNNLTNGLNSLGGVDLGDINVANHLNQMTSDVYSDNDLMESITSTQKVRKLQSTYEKMQTDPKLKGSFATQNFSYDMQAVNQWLSNGERTTSGKGYQGTSTPTPYVDLDKAAVESAKLVREDYTKSTVKDGVYIHNVTKAEVSAEDIKSQVRNTLLQNPMYQTQAKINSWYLRPNVTGDELKTEFLGRIDQTVKVLENDYNQYKKTYDLASPDQQIQMAKALEVKKKNLETYQTTYKDANGKPSKHFEDEKDAYRTNLYVENMTDHLASAMSYTKFTDEAKGDMAQIGLIKMQLDAQSKGMMMVTDPSNPLGYSFVKGPDYDKINSKKSKNGTSTSTTADGFNINEQGQPIANINTDDKVKMDDAKVTDIILTKQDEKQTIFMNMLETLANHNPELVKTLGKDMSIASLADKFKGLNNPDRFEIEDLKNASSKMMTPAQAEYISKLYKSYEAVINGNTPELQLTPDLIDDFTKIHNITREVDFYTTLRNKSMGISTDNLSADVITVAEDGKVKLKEQPLVISKRGDVPYNGSEKDFYAQQITKYGPTGALFAMGSRLNRASAQATGALTDKNILSVYEKDGMLIPADGKDHSYKFVSGIDGKKGGQEMGINVPKEGIKKEDLLTYMKKEWTTAGDLRNELQDLKIFKSPAQYQANESITNKKLIVKDPNAYKIFDETVNYLNYAFPPDVESQKGEGVLNRLKTGILKEGEMGSTTVRDSRGAHQFSYGTEDISKSYISRIGTSANDPSKIEAEITMFSSKKGEGESRKIYKELSQTDLASVGISVPDRTYYLDKQMIALNGRTSPEVIRAQVSANDNMLAIPTSIIETKKGSGKYAPQITIPINGKMTPVSLTGLTQNLNTQDLTASSPQEAKELWSKYLTSLYQQRGIKNNQQLYAYLKKETK